MKKPLKPAQQRKIRKNPTGKGSDCFRSLGLERSRLMKASNDEDFSLRSKGEAVGGVNERLSLSHRCVLINGRDQSGFYNTKGSYYNENGGKCNKNGRKIFSGGGK